MLHDMLLETMHYLTDRTSTHPKVGLVLGSGLGGFVEAMEGPYAVPYADIPHFPRPTAVGHAGKLVFGTINEIPIVVMAGRAHLYEGYTPQQVTYGVRTMAALGVKTLILTNAAGAINADYRVGDLVIMSDHINLQGLNPLTGPNYEALGPRFPDMTEAYAKELRAITKQVAKDELGIDLHEGVYAGLLGPNYETPAEIRYLRAIGADLVGMSTVAECIVANHMGLRVLGLSSAVNMAAGMEAKKLVHEEVLDVGKQMQETLIRLLSAVIPKLV